ncbi:MAG TPA: RNase adapter RapZ [Kofleriaceae bacterium]|nr:RNase adapter RapZ [Kofleriaceae bacterium]
MVTGLSGAGKSTALRALEDGHFFCVDNLPLPLVLPLVELVARQGFEQAAVSVDARQHMFLDSYRETVMRLRAEGHRVEVLFLEAPDDVLLRRYSETRRRHPLSGDELSDGIHRDREILAQLREDATVIATGGFNVHELKALIQERYVRQAGSMAVTLQSFGYKHGLPPDSDLVFDVRFLPNPYFVSELSAGDGREPRVAEFVLQSPQAGELVDHLERFLRFSLPNFAREGKLYLTVAVGCTGGRHRSVAVVEELNRRLAGDWDLHVRHRDLNRAAER